MENESPSTRAGAVDVFLIYTETFDSIAVTVMNLHVTYQKLPRSVPRLFETTGIKFDLAPTGCKVNYIV